MRLSLQKKDVVVYGFRLRAVPTIMTILIEAKIADSWQVKH